MKAAKVLELIQDRTGDRVNMAELAALAGCCTRTVRRVTEKLRRAGVSILSSCSPTTGGYWIGSNTAELEAWRQHFTKAGKSMLKTAAALRADSGQLPLFDLADATPPPDATPPNAQNTAVLPVGDTPQNSSRGGAEHDNE